jgi:type IV pilus assembly protein PilC
VVIGILTPLLARLLRTTEFGRGLSDALILWTPLFGPPLRWNRVARWCDAARIGVQANLDLPEAIALSNDVVASPALQDDGARMRAALQQGRPVTEVDRPLRILPATVPAAIDLAARRGDLASVLRTLSSLYQRQAEIRLNAIPSVLTPILLLLIASLVGLVIAGLMLPLLRLFGIIGGGGSL